MEKFVNTLRRDYKHLTFREGSLASWSPHTSQISYSTHENEENIWSILHEVGHALIGHTSYTSDVDLLKKETEAWGKAITIGQRYGLTIDERHMQACLDTYRDWLYKRSTCPTCGNHGLQRSQHLYFCLNCRGEWKVSSARFCRSYRLKITLDNK